MPDDLRSGDGPVRPRSAKWRPPGEGSGAEGAFFSLIGLAEFGLLPLLSLFVTPLLVRAFGIAPYGLWITATALILGVNLVSFGLPDWLVVKVGAARAVPNWRQAIQVLWGDTLLLGVGAAGLGSLLSIGVLLPTILHRAPLSMTSDWSIVALTATAAGLRSFEILLLGLVRGCERWDLAGAVGIGARLANLGSVLGLALFGRSLALILLGQNVISMLTLFSYFQILRSELGAYPRVMRPAARRLSVHLRESRPFWAQTGSSAVVHSLDRVVVSLFFGLNAVTGYAVCTQVTQQIYTASWSAANWIVPRVAKLSASAQHQTVSLIERWGWALGTGFALVAVALLAMLGGPFLRVWMGPTFASEWSGLLMILGISMALFALPIVPWYVVQAIGLASGLVPVYLIGVGFGICVFALTKNIVGVESVAVSRGAVALVILIGVLVLLKRARAEQADAPIRLV